MKEPRPLKNKKVDHHSETNQIIWDLEIRSHMLIEDGINTFDDYDLQAVTDWIINDKKLRGMIHKFIDIRLIAKWLLESEIALELLADYTDNLIKQMNQGKGG